MPICNVRACVSSAVALFDSLKMTDDAVTPTALTLPATRWVKQPKEYGSSSALEISSVTRANVLPVHVHSAEASEENPGMATSVHVASTPQLA